MKDLQRYTIAAQDGDIGRVDDVYFDDQSWTVRHVVVDTGGWLTGRSVLIPPRAIQAVDAAHERLVTHLTREQVERSPGLETARPVSRQYEMDLYGHYGYPYYWTGPYRWGMSAYPYAAPYPSAAPYPPGAPGLSGAPAVAEELRARQQAGEDSTLRSARDVSGHGIQATDGELGHVEDYLIEMTTWAVRYLIVDPRNWWPGNHVLVPTEWITAVHWNDSTVQVDVAREAVRNAPPFDPATPIDRDFEARYHLSHGRPGYWRREPDSSTVYPPAA
jgi:sporulation protein YlmC with PRC-barrel domain